MAQSIKNANNENFPVGSWLISNANRYHVSCFYEFARAADDIADNPELTSDKKIKLLNGFEDALLGKKSMDPAFLQGSKMAESLRQTGVNIKHCNDLILAFKQDALKSRYDNWSDLIAYCNLSAAPVGRYLIELHGGSKNGYWASDSLCVALQLINHLQDCGEDYKNMDRVYLPMDWVQEANLDLNELGDNKSSPALRKVFNWMLLGIDEQLRDAKNLSSSLYSRRLGLEVSVIYQIACSLRNQLKTNDPLSKRIKLPRTLKIISFIRGVAAGLIS